MHQYGAIVASVGIGSSRLNRLLLLPAVVDGVRVLVRHTYTAITAFLSLGSNILIVHSQITLTNRWNKGTFREVL